ncbi:MAG: DNA-directed RNA polymerase subunit alpha [bacterium]
MYQVAFKRPKSVEWEKSTISNSYGKFVAEPFERGSGITIGNSLRRTLLSGLTGAAITSVQIEGVYHEFTTIPGVEEDVTDIILNLKEVRLKLLSPEPKKIYIDTSGGEKRTVCAGDIIADADVEIMNPDLVISNLDTGASLKIEMEVRHGKGYVPAENNKVPGSPIGVIFIDSVFSPVKKVNFWVEDTLEPDDLMYDRLVMEIWTYGSVSPEEAIINAAKILKENCNVFAGDEEEPEIIETVEEEKDTLASRMEENLSKNVNELELSVRAANCLKNANIKTIRDLVQKTEAEMLRTKNFGRKSLNEIKELISEMNLGFGMKFEDRQDT